VLLKACLNGARSAASHPALPVTPDQLAADAQAAVGAGAGAVHVHPRDRDGRESLRGAVIAEVLEVMRQSVDIPIGVTTGAWVVPDPRERIEIVRGWRVLPDFASVNFHEDGARAVAETLIERGVGVEVGIWTAASASEFASSGLGPSCLRILVEPMDPEPLGAKATVRSIEAVVGGLGIPLLLHGFQATAWPMLDEAILRGYDTRMGLEDTLQLPDGTTASGNAELVATASARMDTRVSDEHLS
jgi:uncharacterized protein (DUF849 family)